MAIEFEDRSGGAAPTKIPWDARTMVMSVNVSAEKVLLYAFASPLLGYLRGNDATLRVFADMMCIIADGDATLVEIMQEKMNAILDAKIEELDTAADRGEGNPLPD
jgi:hypothetical protein